MITYTKGNHNMKSCKDHSHRNKDIFQSDQMLSIVHTRVVTWLRQNSRSLRFPFRRSGVKTNSGTKASGPQPMHVSRATSAALRFVPNTPPHPCTADFRVGRAGKSFGLSLRFELALRHRRIEMRAIQRDVHKKRKSLHANPKTFKLKDKGNAWKSTLYVQNHAIKFHNRQTRPAACRTFKRKKSLQAEKFLLSNMRCLVVLPQKLKLASNIC